MTNRLKYGPRLILGYDPFGRPIYSVAGSAGDEEFDIGPDNDPEEGDDEPQDADPEDDTGKGGKSKYEPPSRAEWVRTQASLAKANASAKTRREENAALTKRLAELETREQERAAAEERARLTAQTQPSDPPGGKGRKRAQVQPTAPGLPDNVLTPTQVRQREAAARKAAEEEVTARYQDQIKRSSAAAELAGEGVPKASAKRLVALLDLSQIDLDDDGNILGGLEDQISELKSELPQLFAPAVAEPEKPKRQRPAPPRIPQANAADRQPVMDRPKSTAEFMASQILGQR